MKVRILGNTIRYRLTQSEVSQFRKTGEIIQVTEFGIENHDKLSFILRSTPGEEYQVDYHLNAVIVQVPERVCREWTETELVGFEEGINTGKGKTLHVLVEKDFKCLDGSDKENEDTYPNPNEHC